jgi:hypothetical protein
MDGVDGRILLYIQYVGIIGTISFYRPVFLDKAHWTQYRGVPANARWIIRFEPFLDMLHTVEEKAGWLKRKN